MATAEPVGAKLYIGPATAATSKSQYAALTWVEIQNIDTIPQIGPTANVTKFTPLGTGITQKKKGSVDNGDPEVVCFLDNKDPGQLAAGAAQKTKFAYAFKLDIPDAASASAVDSLMYFHAIVSGFNVEPGSADNIPRRRIALGITDTPLEVPTV